MKDNTAVEDNVPGNTQVALKETTPCNWERLRAPVLIFLAGMLIAQGVFLWQMRGRLREGYQDFTIFYCAGKMLNMGLAGRLYDDLTQYQVQFSFAPDVEIRKGPLPYNHPPFEALLFSPFAKLPYFTAYLIWDSFNLIMLGSMLLVLRPHIVLLQRVSLVWPFLTTLAFFPLFMSLVQGQDVVLLLLLLALAYTALKRDAEFLAGCWLGFGTFRFHLVVPVVLVLLLRRRSRTISGFALISSILSVISIAMVGWRQALEYPRYLLRIEKALGRRAIAPPEMPNFRGLLHSLLASHISPNMVTALTAVLSLALIVYVSLKWNPLHDNLDLAFSLCLICSILTSYHAYIYDLSVTWFAALAVINAGCSSKSRTVRSTWLYIPIGLLFFTPLQLWLFNSQKLWLFALVLLVWAAAISKELASLSSPSSIQSFIPS
jgi:hypothetical protein